MSRKRLHSARMKVALPAASRSAATSLKQLSAKNVVQRSLRLRSAVRRCST
jgi:hypothetical protein